MVAVFEGNDGAGKGGAIRRVTGALDARSYDNVVVAAPTEEERAQPYLWRFWRHLPRRGDSRSSTAPGTAACWSSASRASAQKPTGCAHIGEINDFEQPLVRHHVVVVKFWLAITKEEQ